MQQERTACLALHLYGKFLTERVRRQYEIAGSVLSLARVLLAERCESALAAAARCLNALKDCSTIYLIDADYPRLLAETDYAPFALFIKGNRAIISQSVDHGNDPRC